MRIVIAVTAIAVGLALVPREADACSCIDPKDSISLIAPEDGATEVPVNAKIWVGGGRVQREYNEQTGKMEASPIELLDNQDQLVEGTKSTLEAADGVVYLFKPAVSLTAGGTYRVRAGETVLSTFTAGSDSDTVAPAIPTVLSEDGKSNPESLFGQSSCGPSFWVKFELKTEGILNVVDRDNTSALDTQAPSGTASSIEATPSVWLGSSGCTTNWPDATSGASAQVRFGTFDIAGNFSGFSAPREAEIPSSFLGCGCSAGAAPGAALMMGLAMLMRRRRR